MVMQLPMIDINRFTAHGSDDTSCKEVADALIQYGAFLVKDDRISNKDNREFLDLMTDYFGLPLQEKIQDVRRDLSYQVGATPAYQEDPKCGTDTSCIDFIKTLDDNNKPTQWEGPDAKWRFFWRIGKCHSEKYPQLTAAPVIPKAFEKDWEMTMNKWGDKLVDTGMVVCSMAAIGLGYDKNAFFNLTQGGPHLLAPTGSDLTESKVGDVFAAFHYDLNFISIHGKSDYSGLNIWTRDGKRECVSVPEGCLLVQAGKQLEYVTGGKIVAGYHEVVVNEKTLQARDIAKRKSRPLWRVSSTVFLHAHSDKVLQPIENETPAYPPLFVGEFVQNELRGIKLRK